MKSNLQRAREKPYRIELRSGRSKRYKTLSGATRAARALKCKRPRTVRIFGPVSLTGVEVRIRETIYREGILEVFS